MAEPVQQKATCCIKTEDKKFVIEFRTDIDFLKAEIQKQINKHSQSQTNRKIQAFSYIHPNGKTITIISNECLDEALKCFPSNQLFEMQCIFHEQTIHHHRSNHSINKFKKSKSRYKCIYNAYPQ